MSDVTFRKQTVAVFENNNGSYPMNTFHALGDMNGDGKPDVVMGARRGRMVWFENLGPDLPWKEHLVDPAVDRVECGGSTYGVQGSGLPDIICGSGGASEIWWWARPPADGRPWKRHTVLRTEKGQFHDTLVGDPTNTGRMSLVFTNQGPGGTDVWCVPFPSDPLVSPWPGASTVVTGTSEELRGPDGSLVRSQPEEGLALGDIDGDGELELVSGTHWHKYVRGAWRTHRFARGYVTTKIAVADLDGDGRNEILLAEGDPCIYGKTQGGRAAWFKPDGDITGLWTEHVLEDGLLDAHTLCVGDLRGSGALDIVVGEIGVADPDRGYARRPPRILAFLNDGKAAFRRQVIDEGTGIHDGILADVFGRGRLDLVGKPLHGAERWHLHVYVNG